MPVNKILALGAEEDPSKFNMAHMGLRLGQRANGVSQLHGRVSRGMFNALWPGFDAEEVPITSITNGVHAPTWMAREILDLAEREAGSDALAAGGGWEASTRSATPNSGRSSTRCASAWSARSAAASGQQPGARLLTVELGWTSHAFDPDVLTIGFARRVPSYKRLTLMLRDPARLKKLLHRPGPPGADRDRRQVATRPTTAARN